MVSRECQNGEMRMLFEVSTLLANDSEKLFDRIVIFVAVKLLDLWKSADMFPMRDVMLMG